MKQTLYLFNPENDMALACGDPYYMPPASARKMAADLSALSGWYAEDGATVLLASEEQVAWMEERASAAGTAKSAESLTGIGRCFAPRSVRWLSLSEGATGEGRDLATAARICPWGWNPSLVRRLREAGVSATLLPDDGQMQAIRTLSGRQTAVRVLQRLKERGMNGRECPFELLGESFVFTTASEVRAFVEGRPKALLKAPWSGSGRGVQYTQGLFSAPLQGWVRHVLHTQQAVVGEPFYEKVIDFAMEFRVEVPSVSSDLSSASSELSSTSSDLSSVSSDLSSVSSDLSSASPASAPASHSAAPASHSAAPASHSSVRFVGYSWFETDARGIYKENWLASDAAIEARLAAYVPVEVLHRIRKRLEEELEQALQGAYEGYLGVDMMVCRGSEAGSYALHPCVEINLRTNMGVVARRLYDNYVCPASQGRYVIEYYPQSGEALRRHQAMQEAHPLVVEDGRLRSGYFSLTPVLEDTQYQAYGIVEEGETFRSVMAPIP